MKAAQPVQKDGPRINEDIRVREVQLIDATGHNHGPTPIQTALEMAQAAGGSSLPLTVRGLMRLAADVMRAVAYRI